MITLRLWNKLDIETKKSIIWSTCDSNCAYWVGVFSKPYKHKLMYNKEGEKLKEILSMCTYYKNSNTIKISITVPVIFLNNTKSNTKSVELNTKRTYICHYSRYSEGKHLYDFKERFEANSYDEAFEEFSKRHKDVVIKTIE